MLLSYCASPVFHSEMLLKPLLCLIVFSQVDFRDKLYLAPLTTVSSHCYSCIYGQLEACLIRCVCCSVGICRSGACASASEQTSRVERWPWSPICCRVRRLNGLCSRDTPRKICSAFRYEPLHAKDSTAELSYEQQILYSILFHSFFHTLSLLINLMFLWNNNNELNMHALHKVILCHYYIILSY